LAGRVARVRAYPRVLFVIFDIFESLKTVLRIKTRKGEEGCGKEPGIKWLHIPDLGQIYKTRMNFPGWVLSHFQLGNRVNGTCVPEEEDA